MCRRELRLKSREISILKGKIEVLEKKEIDLRNYKRINRELKQIVSSKDVALNDMRMEMERITEERRKDMEDFKRNTENLILKLEKAKDYSDAMTNRNYNKTNSNNDNFKSKMKEAFIRGKKTESNKPKLFILGDEYSKGLGVKLYDNTKFDVYCQSKPYAKFVDLIDDINQAITEGKQGDAIMVIAGGSRDQFGRRIWEMEKITRATEAKSIKLYISTINYVSNMRKNEKIYSANCRLYDIVGNLNHGQIIEINDRTTSLTDKILFNLKYPTHMMKNLISVSIQGREECMAAEEREHNSGQIFLDNRKEETMSRKTTQ
jgi:hypothetical protein